MEKYYAILGVNENASLDELKKAFKSKARVLHPDVNRSPNAHAQFILLNEAYQYLQNLKTGKVFSDQFENYSNQKPYRRYQDFVQKDQQTARKRAEYYAKQRYQQFKNSPYYKRSLEIQAMANQVAILCVVLFILLVVVGSIAAAGSAGIFVALFILIASAPNWLDILKSSGKLNVAILLDAIVYLARHPIFQTSMLVILNVAVFFLIALNTLINLKLYLILSLGFVSAAIILGWTLFRSVPARKKALWTWGISPSIISIFFLINFLISFNPHKETYSYSIYKEYRYKNTYSGSTYRYTRPSSMIILDGDRYEEYGGIRFFFDIDRLGGGKITYTIEEGLFGIRVVKDIALHR